MNKEIMDILKEKFENVSGKRQYEADSGAREYYLAELSDNLYMPMSVGAEASYSRGSGNELEDKMRALRSSSALTYNLFWDQIAEFTGKSKRIGKGIYQVELEKQFHTLKSSVSKIPANLDAFLYCKNTKEAVACEMKMMEWLFNKPGKLRKAYLNPENYIDKVCGNTFADVARQLIHDEYKNADMDEYPCRMCTYDAFQMFKHAVACYSACSYEEVRKIEKLTLVNCVWTLPNPEKLSDNAPEEYTKKETSEHNEFKEFKKIMKPVKECFKDLKVDFDIEFYTFGEFLSLLDKTADELDYLKRYTFDR